MVRLPAIELVAPLALLSLVMTAPVHAEVTFKPAVSVRETYTDNSALTSSDNTSGQFVSELSPSVSMAANGPRLKLLGQLSAHLFSYSGGRSDSNNSTDIQLGLNGKAKLIEDLFFLDGSATRSRQSISAFGPQFQNDYSNVNSDTVTTYSISPYLVHKFGSFADAQLRYTHDGVKSSRNLLSTSTSDTALFDLNSGPSFSSFGWSVRANHQSIDDPAGGTYQLDNVLGTLRYRVKSGLSIYTNGGYDRYTYVGQDGSTRGKNYSVGFTWTPSLRTSIDASLGRRYFGKTASLAANVRSRNTLWNATYVEDVTTARAQFLKQNTFDTATLLDSSFAAAFPDPVARRQAIEAYIRALGLPASVSSNVNYFSNRLLLQKQFQASVVLSGSRSTAIASIGTSKRTALSLAQADASLGNTGFPGLNDDTRQRSATLAFSYRLSPRAAATLSLVKSRVLSLATNIEQDQTGVNFVLTKQFERRLSGSLELRRNQGSTLDLTGRGYRENAISASLNYQL